MQRAVKVMIPGTHFTTLTSAEQAVEYQGTAMEYDKNHKFGRHKKAWGDPHTGEGIRFVCESDAFDDPNHRGLWTTLTLWNRWRHDTYERDREAEVQFLDELPAVKAGSAPPPASEQHENALNFEPEVKKHFWVARVGTHVVQGQGKNKGKRKPCTWYVCKQPGCKRGRAHPIKQVGADTGGLFSHLESCQPSLCRTLRIASKASKWQSNEDGEVYQLYSFDELLPHHARYVKKCFRGFDHFNETRSDNGLKEYVQGYNRWASRSHPPATTPPAAALCTRALWRHPCAIPFPPSLAGGRACLTRPLATSCSRCMRNSLTRSCRTSLSK